MVTGKLHVTCLISQNKSLKAIALRLPAARNSPRAKASQYVRLVSCRHAICLKNKKASVTVTEAFWLFDIPLEHVEQSKRFFSGSQSLYSCTNNFFLRFSKSFFLET